MRELAGMPASLPHDARSSDVELGSRGAAVTEGDSFVGRKKPGKAGRRRQGAYTLQQLQPPGYDEWIKFGSHATADDAAGDPRLGEMAVGLMQRLPRLRPLYRGPIPLQAVRLDMALDSGALAVSCEGESEEAALVPIEELATMMGVASSGGDVRESVHRLHSVGALLVEDAGDAVPLVRIVSQPPRRPGDPWVFHRSPEDMLVPKTCIPAQPGDLAPDEFAALGFIRCHMSRGTEATAEDFAQHEGIGSVERALELWPRPGGSDSWPSAGPCGAVAFVSVRLPVWLRKRTNSRALAGGCTVSFQGVDRVSDERAGRVAVDGHLVRRLKARAYLNGLRRWQTAGEQPSRPLVGRTLTLNPCITNSSCRSFKA